MIQIGVNICIQNYFADEAKVLQSHKRKKENISKACSLTDIYVKLLQNCWCTSAGSSSQAGWGPTSVWRTFLTTWRPDCVVSATHWAFSGRIHLIASCDVFSAGLYSRSALWCLRGFVLLVSFMLSDLIILNWYTWEVRKKHLNYWTSAAIWISDLRLQILSMNFLSAILTNYSTDVQIWWFWTQISVLPTAAFTF